MSTSHSIFEHAPRPLRRAHRTGFGKSSTVLIVEEMIQLRDLIADCLESQGYAVLKARNRIEADFFSEEYPGPIHLLVIDADLALADARQTLQRLRVHRPALRALFLCGPFENKGLPEEEEQVGIVLWPKPFSAEALLEAIHDALTKSSTD